MIELISPQFVHVRISAASREELFSLMAGRLREQGKVKRTFLQGLLDREMNYPTGLKINGGIAIPHTDAEHVIEDAISIATLAKPVGFREMAGVDDTEIPVDIVFMLALGKSGHHIEILQRLMKSFQDVEFISMIRHSLSAQEIAGLTLGKLGFPITAVSSDGRISTSGESVSKENR